jgi:hypothetical protein
MVANGGGRCVEILSREQAPACRPISKGRQRRRIVLGVDMRIGGCVLGWLELGGGAGWALCNEPVSPFLVFFPLNSYIERSIRFCMHVDDTKCELTP